MMSAVLMLGGPIGCKNKKKLAEQQRAEMEKKKTMVLNRLQSIIDSRPANFDELQALERQLDEVKAMNMEDGQVMILIKRAEFHLQKERERLEAEAKAQEEANNPPPVPKSTQEMLSDALNGIAGSGNTGIANMNIQNALSMFSSPNAPVLIIIAQENGKNDYDRPTTIQKYLNYLKDVGKNPNKIENVVLDSNGKIKELELIKRN
ncbi:MAG: hypothetical protein AAF206_18975 [Bacteroidota bacterium]